MPNPAKKNGRPKIEIEFKVVAGMCGVWATEKEIADYFKCSISTLKRRCHEETGDSFERFYKKNNSNGTISLRRAQYKFALAGNPGLLIWLGKQYLGQKDKQEITDETRAVPTKVEIMVVDASKG